MLKREVYLSRIRGFYDSDLVKILVGIRRCGKSVILNQIVDEIKEKGIEDDHIIYVNFELVEYEELQDYRKLNKYIKDNIKDDKIYYIFLDEIQRVEKFETVVNSLRASLSNISIFITGSNSKLLSNELSTVLSGRYVLFNIYPLSYKEFTELSLKNPRSEETFWNFVKWGGLPNRVQFTDEVNIKDYLHSVFDSIILRDVVERLGLKDIVLFNLLLQYVVDRSVEKRTELFKLAQQLKSKGFVLYVALYDTCGQYDENTTLDSLYEVPLMLEEQNLADIICQKVGLEVRQPDLEDWKAMVQTIKAAKEPVRIALVGKYVALHDAYLSVSEALYHAGFKCGADVKIEWIDLS